MGQQELSVSDQADQLMQEMNAWGQSQYNTLSGLGEQAIGSLMQNFSALSGIGSNIMKTYNADFIPEYQNLVNDANNYASPARIQQAMGAAESGVAQSFSGQRNAALADLEGMGVDPSSGRYAALDAAERTQQAASQAGAGFQAEQATEATGRGLRSEALQIGNTMPGQATAAYGAGSQAASAAGQTAAAIGNMGANMMGVGAKYGQVAMDLKYPPQSFAPSQGQGKSSSSTPSGGGQGTSGNDYYAPNTPGWDAANYDQSTGGSGYGGSGGGGLGGGWDISPANANYGYDSGGGGGDGGGDGGGGGGGDSFAEGGEVPGRMVPTDASPSGGLQTDDVPARVADTGENIRVNADEFIMPKDVVRWKGEEYFQNLINESRKVRGEGSAKPEIKKPLPSQRGGMPAR
jgi:hypothetical protein